MLRLILALWLATAQAQEPLVVRYDPGGVIATRALEIARLGDRPVRIVGLCQSSCTMYLHARDVCVTPGARLTFHGPSWHGFPMGEAHFDHWSRFLAAYYPATLAAWFMETGRHGTFTIDGAGMIANGWAREC